MRTFGNESAACRTDRTVRKGFGGGVEPDANTRKLLCHDTASIRVQDISLL